MNTFLIKNYMPTLKEYRRKNEYGVKCLVCVMNKTKIKDKSVSHSKLCTKKK